MEHLSLEIFDLTGTGSKYAVLEPDAGITITDTSEIFASGDVWSHSFTLNVHANSHIFGTAGDLHGSRLHEQVNKRRARLWVEGVPMFLGYLRLDDEAEVDADGNVDVGFESGAKTFEEKIEGAKASQVPLIGDVRIGVALWQKRWTKSRMKLSAHVVVESDQFPDRFISVQHAVLHADGSEVMEFGGDGESPLTAVQEYPQMVFPKGEFVPADGRDAEEGIVNELNTDYPYTEDEDGTPTHPYCNVALCYQRQGYERKQDDGSDLPDYSAEPEPQRGYEVMPADRVNSAPNFFVLYWLRALMNHLGIYIEENQMMDVEDLRRLFFVNTKCAYRKPSVVRGSNPDPGYGRYTFAPGFRLVPEHFGERKDTEIDGRAEVVYDAQEKLVKTEECKFEVTGFSAGELTPVFTAFHPIGNLTVRSVVVRAEKVIGMDYDIKNDYIRNNSYLHDAYATSECFPDVDISEVIKAIEDGFGVRLLFDGNYQRVRIVLLRNIFRSQEVQDIDCEIEDGDEKVENSIRGFRMTYGNTEDTHFYYKGFADKLPHMKTLWPDDSDTHDYSKWDLGADYADVTHKVSAFNKTCYVTPETGNAYIVKVDKDAKRYDDLHPSLFGCADFMDAEDGDCTGEAETISEVSVGFKPAVMNDLNIEDADGKTRQQFALFVDEKMRVRRPDLEDLPNSSQPGIKTYSDSGAFYDVDGKLYARTEDGDYRYKEMMADDGVVKPGEFAITSDLPAAMSGLRTRVECEVIGNADGQQREVKGRVVGDITDLSISGHVNEGYRLYLQDNYEPNDDGIPPIETHDWGLTLGIMRGSGSDMHVAYEADPDDRDGEYQNDTWEIEPGSSVTSHPDTCNNYGELWDYNGTPAEAVIPENAAAKLEELFPSEDRNAPLYTGAKGYVDGANIFYVTGSDGITHRAMFAMSYSISGRTSQMSNDWGMYMYHLSQYPTEEVMEQDRAGYGGLRNLIIELDSTPERCMTMLELLRMAYGGSTDTICVDNGVGSLYGRFSLKLRAEKPNPYYDPTQPETYYDPEHPENNTNPRYLHIDNKDLQGRGLADQFYKEYSYWVRNARIAKRTVHMELAQLLSIDKTRRVRVGDITGFIRKMQYTVSNKTGLSKVTMEIMYI